MPHGMVSRRCLGSILLCSGALLTGAAAPSGDLVTEMIEGEQLVLESTTSPSLFTALAPGDVIEWDVSISTTEPAESIDAELFTRGEIPMAAAVYACQEPWSGPPNMGGIASACAQAAKLQASHEVPSGTSEEAFEVEEQQHLRIVLEMGSFDTEASGTVELRVTANGELLEAEPPQEPGLLSAKDESSLVPSSEEGVSHRPEQEPDDRAYPGPSVAEQPKEPLPATGAAVGVLLVTALALIAVGTYLRRRARRLRHP